ncbi:MAG: AAA family ATPase [Kiritimatiellia bacterium]
MYLKRVELIGFKSFAEKTVLNFEPGWTAVVGPNGCGKSNISDAIRWVLGEQSAKALRGGSMADVIFNGTDTHKPLNMAEVSLTLAECEKALGMEYNEVTITRRVHRSGDSAYYLNKAPCRLKDIQRLFMDTGIGRNSYSIMEQGKIDQILSSRPEDRRAVFEEASGITKYKADRKEALRKLEQTDLNLQRSDDVIREVKRQIISLQRQAGKARRYKEIAAQMQGYEIFSAGHRLQEFDARLEEIGNQAASLAEQLEAHREEIEQTEQVAAATREALTATDVKITEAMEQAARRAKFEAARQAIQINQDRIRELEEVAGRDSRATPTRPAPARRPCRPNAPRSKPSSPPPPPACRKRRPPSTRPAPRTTRPSARPATSARPSPPSAPASWNATSARCACSRNSTPTTSASARPSCARSGSPPSRPRRPKPPPPSPPASPRWTRAANSSRKRCRPPPPRSTPSTASARSRAAASTRPGSASTTSSRRPPASRPASRCSPPPRKRPRPSPAAPASSCRPRATVRSTSPACSARWPRSSPPSRTRPRSNPACAPGSTPSWCRTPTPRSSPRPLAGQEGRRRPCCPSTPSSPTPRP